MFKHMLIPIDGSKCASDALRQAIELARDMRAKVTLLVVTEPFRLLSAEASQIERVRGEFEKFQHEHAAQYLGWAREFAQGHAVTCDTVQVEHDQPYVAIIDTANKYGCDVIAMGSHGYGGVKAVVLGSVTQKVLTHCQTPVLVYR
ncbi:UspA domain-containing protein [Bordetella sputigena]|uniref:universal stress protein n=1 Tax=Bordetella sputigena TaxID=1416810 RepID=UPI0039F04B97